MTPEQLDEARAKEAERLWSSGDPNDPTIPDIATVAARLAREGWTPPDPVVDPDLLAWREWFADGPGHRHKADVIAGHWDTNTHTTAYLAGARMAREQERERAKVLVECVERYAGPHAPIANAALAKYRGEA